MRDPTPHDNSLDRAVEEQALLHEIWLLVVQEAYRHNRIEAISGMSEDEIVSAFFRRNSRVEAWANTHIENRTCALAVEEMRAKRHQMSQPDHPKQNTQPQKVNEPPAIASPGISPSLKQPRRGAVSRTTESAVAARAEELFLALEADEVHRKLVEEFNISRPLVRKIARSPRRRGERLTKSAE